MNKKHIVITGGSKGIGLACSALFLDEGWRVTALDLDTKVPIKNTDFQVIKCDVSKGADVKSAMETAIAKFGEIDALVNNAGIQTYDNVVDTTEEKWDLTMNVNLKSAFLCAKYAIPSMLKVGKGVVVNVSSVQAFMSQHVVAAYTTSKSALLGLTRSIAVDFAPKIRCVAVCPGTIDTPMLRNSIQESPDPEKVLRECVDMHPLEKIGTPEEMAGFISFLVSEKASFITGQAYRIDGGLGITIAGSRQET